MHTQTARARPPDPVRRWYLDASWACDRAFDPPRARARARAPSLRILTGMASTKRCGVRGITQNQANPTRRPRSLRDFFEIFFFPDGFRFSLWYKILKMIPEHFFLDTDAREWSHGGRGETGRAMTSYYRARHRPWQVCEMRAVSGSRLRILYDGKSSMTVKDRVAVGMG